MFYAGRDLNQTGRTRDFKNDPEAAMHWVEARLREHLGEPDAQIVLAIR